VGDQGEMLDTMDGRLINPGHAIEACWFLMDIGDRLGDSKLIQTAVDISIRMLEYGWDPDHEGIFYFMDMKGLPMQQLEWDQKLWWVHLESIIATLKGYALTKDIRCWQWFEKLHDYSWSHFHDPEYGEWYGYLKRDGSLLNPSKGGKWKGCFHVPRGLFYAHGALERIQAGQRS
jgi:N-acylglucosamine 2-epimerase